jgi:hypothetical protein
MVIYTSGFFHLNSDETQIYYISLFCITMKKRDQKSEQPNLEHILGVENSTLSIFLRGHLVIEALLTQLLPLRETIISDAYRDVRAVVQVLAGHYGYNYEIAVTP